MEEKQLKNILEASLLVAGRAMSVSQLEALFQEDENQPDKKMIREALQALQQEYEGRGIELVEIASGYRLQSHDAVRHWVSKLFQERTPRYSRALLETLVLIAYRQPITRAEIEEVRGVAVSSNIIKTLQERNWVKVIGYKDVPGRPALLGTTKEFLDYFNLKRLDDLPTLTEIKDLDQFDALLAEEIGVVEGGGDAANDDASNDEAGNSEASNSEASNSEASNSEASNSEASNGRDELKANDDDNDVDANESAEFASDSLLENAQLEDVAIELDDIADNELAGHAQTDGESHGEEQHKIDDESASLSLNVEPSVSSDNAQSESASPGMLESTDVVVSDVAKNSPSDGLEEQTAHVAAENNDLDLTQSEFSNAEHQLYKVIADFADEHQQEIDARDDLEERQLSTGQSVNDAASAKNTELNDADVSAEIEVEEKARAQQEEALAQELASDLSQRLTSEELKAGDLPEPGDTLH